MSRTLNWTAGIVAAVVSAAVIDTNVRSRDQGEVLSSLSTQVESLSSRLDRVSTRQEAQEPRIQGIETRLSILEFKNDTNLLGSFNADHPD